jgi:molecular chaperone IbpB/HSP20 family protein
MKDRDFMDIGRILDEIFSAAEEFGQAFTEGMHFDPKEKWHAFSWREGRDYYPGYDYPPANVYITEDKSLVFEFALAGFAEKDISVEFKGNHLNLGGHIPEGSRETENVRFFKRRLKLKDFSEQKYYVPQDKFDQQAAKATFKNGILKIAIPPREEAKDAEGFTVHIHTEDDENEGAKL